VLNRLKLSDDISAGFRIRFSWIATFVPARYRIAGLSAGLAVGVSGRIRNRGERPTPDFRSEVCNGRHAAPSRMATLADYLPDHESPYCKVLPAPVSHCCADRSWRGKRGSTYAPRPTGGLHHVVSDLCGGIGSMTERTLGVLHHEIAALAAFCLSASATGA